MVIGDKQMVHYHGTPITPKSQLMKMSGRHFCISFADPRDLQRCLSIGQSLMFDNGAFSLYTRGLPLDIKAYYKWLEPVLTPPNWAIIPDEIGGDLSKQQSLLATWPRETFGYANSAPVFHMHMPLSHLHFLVLAYPKVCIGSSEQFWQVGSPAWSGRMDEIFNYLIKHFQQMPWIHGLRMLGQISGGWPFASADSTNIAQNHYKYGCAECLAHRVDGNNPTIKWKARHFQEMLI